MTAAAPEKPGASVRLIHIRGDGLQEKLRSAMYPCGHIVQKSALRGKVLHRDTRCRTASAWPARALR